MKVGQTVHSFLCHEMFWKVMSRVTTEQFPHETNADSKLVFQKNFDPIFQSELT